MKNILYLGIISLLVFLLVGCSNNGDVTKSESSYFEAIILEVNENSLLVEPKEGFSELKSSDKITIPKSNKLAFNEGDLIGITYDGHIAESYPAQILEVQSIKLLPSDEAWVSLRVENVSESGLTLYCKQIKEDAKFSSESFYQVEVYENGNWKELNYIIDNVGWDLLAYIISPEKETVFEIDWEWLYGKLPEGKYRIMKNISMNEVFMDENLNQEVSEYKETIPFYVEFEIK